MSVTLLQATLRGRGIAIQWDQRKGVGRRRACAGANGVILLWRNRKAVEYDVAKEVRELIQFEDGARGLSSTIYGLLH